MFQTSWLLLDLAVPGCKNQGPVYEGTGGEDAGDPQRKGADGFSEEWSVLVCRLSAWPVPPRGERLLWRASLCCVALRSGRACGGNHPAEVSYDKRALLAQAAKEPGPSVGVGRSREGRHRGRWGLVHLYPRPLRGDRSTCASSVRSSFSLGSPEAAGLAALKNHGITPDADLWAL